MISKVDFAGPGRYRIEIHGRFGSDWSKRLGRMQICAGETEDRGTILEGLVDDQAELAGILNSLYELHLTLISVQRIDLAGTEG